MIAAAGILGNGKSRSRRGKQRGLNVLPKRSASTGQFLPSLGGKKSGRSGRSGAPQILSGRKGRKR